MEGKMNDEWMDELSKVDSMDESWKDRGKEGRMMNEWMNSVKLTVWMTVDSVISSFGEWSLSMFPHKNQNL